MKVPKIKCESCKYFECPECTLTGHEFENGHEMLAWSKECTLYKKRSWYVKVLDVIIMWPVFVGIDCFESLMEKIFPDEKDSTR